MEKEEFEAIVAQVFDRLPERFHEAIENVGIIVEDYPDDALVRQLGLKSRHHLYGLYQGIPLTKRGSWYGSSPVTPDRISLYRKNIEAGCRTDMEVAERIYDVLIHEIGHYFGMNEDEIRSAGY